MFALIGASEVALILADAAVLALLLTRWKFNGLRTFLGWLGINIGVVAVYVLVMRLAFASHAGLNPIAAAGIGWLVAFLVTRFVGLRLMSKTSVFREANQPPLA